MDPAEIEEFLAWNDFPEAMRVSDQVRFRPLSNFLLQAG
jgi:hypothetical protein